MQNNESEQPLRVEINPFGCPYCGGPVDGAGRYCSHCDRPLGLRYRKHPGGTRLNWLVFLFVLLGGAAWLEGYFLSQLVSVGQLPQWGSRTGLRFLYGPVIFSPEGVQPDLASKASLITQFHYALALLCVVAAVGLALKSKAVYWGSFILVGLLAMATAAGLLLGLTGWLPFLLLLGLLAASTLWLVDSTSAFEWQIRYYDAGVDPGLKTHVDYYHRGKRYADIGMWAKAAAHWNVATQLSPRKAGYRIDLANAYTEMEYPEVARAEIDRALALVPEDHELQAFRDSLADLEALH